ncbi:aromatic ring-hydroxylating dioxygenase subunit alpha [Sphingobium sp. Cam5-1]|uniref:aromatic ring-hydroxylating dioxygenase subunit alpha n=1 Tax=Sphingobium sp. Cam5-1 TaxID=2789327 RepID=UPI0018AD2DC4|nr:aromatic ring-hydroxylating dioxygenase subunit alpha [Sphingobium sp. Cam5-1]QPI74573.1 aromatic ring-hydroxylating dioxygenase subunit alpha [Sphingobium sp. Cam5-1]
MFIRDAWYVGAWSHELDVTSMMSRRLLGDNILFFRTTDGKVAAIRDRCSHRFAPLSIGRREGDCVRCMYHGLLFDADGKCIEEPGRKGVSPNTNVRSYPTVERYKQVWIWMGDPAKADPDLIPDCHYQDDPAWASIPAYIHYKADYRLILDNLLDFSHLTYVHENTLGGSATIAHIRPKIERDADKVRLTRWYLGEPGIAPYLKGFNTFEGPVDRWHIYELHIPGNVFLMDSGSAPAGSGAPEGQRVSEAMQFRATQIVTPEDEQNSHFFWSYAHNFNIGDREFTAKLAARIAEGFEEDRLMIEAQQGEVNRSAGDQMAFIIADNGLALGRRIIEERLAAEKAGADNGGPQ